MPADGLSKSETRPWLLHFSMVLWLMIESHAIPLDVSLTNRQLSLVETHVANSSRQHVVPWVECLPRRKARWGNLTVPWAHVNGDMVIGELDAKFGTQGVAEGAMWRRWPVRQGKIRIPYINELSDSELSSDLLRSGLRPVIQCRLNACSTAWASAELQGPELLSSGSSRKKGGKSVQKGGGFSKLCGKMLDNRP